MNVGFVKVAKGIDQSVLRQHVLDVLRLEKHGDELTVSSLKEIAVKVEVRAKPDAAPELHWRRYDDWSKSAPATMDVNEYLFYSADGGAYIKVVTYQRAYEKPFDDDVDGEDTK